MHREEVFAGPLPPPLYLERYESVLPGMAERIVAMAEAEQQHRHRWEGRHLWFEGLQGIGGQLIGLIGFLALVGAAVYCAVIGQAVVASVCLGTAAVGAIGVLVQGRRLDGHPKPELVPKSTKPAKRRHK